MDSKIIIFYDGICILCNNAVEFVIKRDKKNTIFFSPLQSPFAKKKYEDKCIDPVVEKMLERQREIVKLTDKTQKIKAENKKLSDDVDIRKRANTEYLPSFAHLNIY